MEDVRIVGSFRYFDDGLVDISDGSLVILAKRLAIFG
jgi:hypothetical protein